MNNGYLVGVLGLTNCLLYSNMLCSYSLNSVLDWSHGGAFTRSSVNILVLILFLSWFSYIEVTSVSVQLSRNNNWVGGIKRVLDLYPMCGLTGNGCQNLWDFIDQYTIHAALHGTKRVIIMAFYLSCLID